MNGRHVPLLALLGLSLAACGARNNSSWSTAVAPSGTEQPVIVGGMPLTTVPGGEALPKADVVSHSKGVGPVKHVDMASLDASRAPVGEELFKVKCSACHKLAERYIGPALAGVTQRREPEWILNQILNPEVMIVQDPVSKALLAEYLAPMANQHLTRDEAESILVYFREYDAAPPAPVETPAADASAAATTTIVK
jgi:mono/diheme cytochrome c family protein